jgi:hypothetical protein
MFNIDNFKSNFLGGARANRFEVLVPTLPDKAKFLIKATDIPGSTLGEIIYRYQGTEIKLAGDKTYSDWQVTMILDSDYAGYNEILVWHNLIREGNTGAGVDNHALYKKDCFVTHYSSNGEVIGEFRMNGAWPKIVPETPLSWDTTDQAMEIQITFSYDYWEKVQ